jgi:hypothetical protein
MNHVHIPTVHESIKAGTADLSDLTIAQLAAIVRRDWRTKDGKPNVWFGAEPYLDAMETLMVVDPKGATYGWDSAESILIYFVSNAAQWRGPVARAVKAELKRRFK